jgi:uncharacterized protein (TIGR03083 family)
VGEVGAAYAGTRERITALLRGVDPTGRVPACPDWTVKDVAAHCAGVVDDVLAGRLDGVATDPWTEKQVAARVDTRLDDILDAWAEQSPAFEAMLDDVGPAGEQAVFDVTTHEHDLRGALAAPGAQDSDAVSIGLRWLAPTFAAQVAENRLGPLCVRTTSGHAWASEDGADAAVEGSPFELFRALSGRRSRSQLCALTWTVAPEPFLPAFEWGPFSTPASDVIDAPIR